MNPYQPYPGPPPPPPQGWPVGGPAPTTDTKAVVALVLGILSCVVAFCYVGWLVGIPAIIFGALAHRDIKRSHGLTAGGGMATAGIVLGSFGTLIGLAVIGFFVFAMLVAKPTPAPVPTMPALGPTPAPTGTATVTAPIGGWGTVHVVVLHATGGTLRSQLESEMASAKASGETVLVETTQAGCAPCGEIQRSVSDPAMQAALTDVELVLVDIDELGPQLRALGMQKPDVPWFFLLNPLGSAVDGISADEWDDNVPARIAPVLSSFVHGALTKRKHPWGKAI